MKPSGYLFSTLIILSSTLHGQEPYSTVRLTIPNHGLAWLQMQGVEFDHGEVNKEENTFLTVLNSTSLVNLQKTGVPYTLLIKDVAADFARRNKVENFYQQSDAIMLNGKLQFETPCGSHITNIPVPAGFIPGSYGGYYTFAQIQKRIDSLVNHYPNLVQKIILPGTTDEGRQLIAVKISDNASTDENEPEALYTGLHHAREGMSMMNLFFFMQYLVENYATDNRVKELVDNRELYFIPCFNPDGYVYNQTQTPGGGGMWRKNRHNNGGNKYGVDLNRNYGVDWGITGPDISTSFNTSADDYVGTGPFSEAETQILRAFAETRHFTMAIDHHAYGNYYVTPYGVPASHPFTTADANFYKYASALMARYNGYFAGDGMATVNYYAVGNSRDWHIAGDIGTGTKQKTYGYTVEVGPGSEGFWPAAVNIIPIAKSMWFGNMQMAYMAGSYFELQDMSTVAVNTTTGNFDFSLRRIGLTDAPATISLIPLENVQSAGAAVVVNSMANYFDTVQRSITYTVPTNLPEGSRVRFIYQISSGGINLRDTVTRLFRPNTVFTDNMEWGSTTNWTFTGAWGTSTATAYQGTRALSESPSGNYSSNTTSYATHSSIDLSNAGLAYLSFWVKHRAENAYDKLQIQLSSGSGYQPACGTNTVAEDVGTLNSQPALTGIREAWTREIIDLKNYVGQSAVNLRFAFSSNSSDVLDGFYIDNIEVVKSSQALLPIKFINVSAIRVSEGVEVSWDAVISTNHDHFEVERSADGVHFMTIGSLYGDAPNSFIDRSPQTVNYYRIKDVDKQGRPAYSKMVMVETMAVYGISLYPNPVVHTLQVRFNLAVKTRLALSVTDMTGIMKYRQEINGEKGMWNKEINVKNWPAQTYLVRVRDLQSGKENIFKLIKM
jgi:carboxypeptidase T